MKRFRLGFTLIEVSLFLALTAALFAGIAAGVQSSIYQQRFNDSVQNFAEFLRTVYSQVLNVQNDNKGRTDYAIYGKLVIFGRESENEKNDIKSYNVVGGIKDSGGTDTALRILKDLNASPFFGETDKSTGITDYKEIGYVESYTPRWGSVIQDSGGKTFQGALLIVRHPNSGIVYTYKLEKELKVDMVSGKIDGGGFNTIFHNYLDSSDGFEIGQMDFCVNPNGPGEGGVRRDVRVVKGARNASGVVIVSDSESVCERI